MYYTIDTVYRIFAFILFQILSILKYLAVKIIYRDLVRKKKWSIQLQYNYVFIIF